ncbi:MFS transporter [Paeniglutamicibacter cryotolerans]|uniref:Putative proline/betaine transporter n=1 Tax=Paeniglutamicibacter cryotolerans TaxID=670079 RepID=A0A839QQD3_9MICC|nr:MFS transporter [Paeniglutamicibacter cryotolerans]MBB2996974.1 MFS family permease [Paeniglutamicibacter cryotolerans]
MDIPSNHQQTPGVSLREQHRSSIRAVSASTIGSVLEYYDFFVFGTLSALVFSHVFFPQGSPGVGAMLAMATFAVGFVARPLGGIILGHFGDKIGRKRVLLFTFMLTGIVTVLIGFLPTYAQVGMAAPALLVLLRVLQGVGIGGEWGGAALLAVEHAPANRRGLYGSIVQAGAPVGVLLASGVVALLTATIGLDAIIAGGWRIPFLGSAVLLIVGLFLRFKVDETPEFNAVKDKKQEAKLPVIEALRRYPKEIVSAIFIHMSDTTLGLVQGVFVLGYASGVLGMDPTLVLLANMFSSVCNLIITPIAGHLGDRLGQKRILTVGLVLMGLWAFPMFWLIGTATVWGLFTATGVCGMLVGLLFSQQATLFADMFHPSVRYSGMSMGFQVGTVIGGGFGPLIAQGLTTATGGATWSVSTYILFVAMLALVATLLVKPRFGSHAHGLSVPVPARTR